MAISDYQPTIGIEVHVELATLSKMFCSCPRTPVADKPNSSACPVCLGLPGALPAINRSAVELGMRAALALNAALNEIVWFERKNYLYPDLVKGYQISQYAVPLGERGWLEIAGDDGRPKRVGIRRVHLEEDTAKLVHEGGGSFVDVNRSGAPLLEIVTDPDLASAAEAEAYARRLRSILVYNGVSRCRIQWGEMRVEPNVSIAPKGSDKLGTRTEIKNQAGFNHMRSAVEYEIKRQAELLDRGGRVEQQTLGWDVANSRTVPQRSKEDAHDYRYFPEPDLPFVRIDPAWGKEVGSAMPEPLDAYVERLASAGIGEKDIEALAARDAFGFLREAADGGERASLLAKRLAKDVFSLANSTGVTLEDSRLEPPAFRNAVMLLEDGKINAQAFRQVLETLYRDGGEPAAIAEKAGLFIKNDPAAATAAIAEVLAECAGMVADYKAGKTAVKNALLGRALKKLGGRADPKSVAEALARALDG